MEEEIICNRWKDLADGPQIKRKWSISHGLSIQRYKLFLSSVLSHTYISDKKSRTHSVCLFEILSENTCGGENTRP